MPKGRVKSSTSAFARGKDGAWWSLPKEMAPGKGLVQRASWQVGGLGNGSYGDAKVEVVHVRNGVGLAGRVEVASRRLMGI